MRTFIESATSRVQIDRFYALQLSPDSLVHSERQNNDAYHCIQIPAEMVTYNRDIKDVTDEYTFTDGVGTISECLRDQVCQLLN